MAKVANLMANHNGNPTAVASLYDEKISVIKDEHTVVLVHFTEDGLVDECGNNWNYCVGTDTLTTQDIITQDCTFYSANSVVSAAFANEGYKEAVLSSTQCIVMDSPVELGGNTPFRIEMWFGCDTIATLSSATTINRKIWQMDTEDGTENFQIIGSLYRNGTNTSVWHSKMTSSNCFVNDASYTHPASAGIRWFGLGTNLVYYIYDYFFNESNSQWKVRQYFNLSLSNISYRWAGFLFGSGVTTSTDVRNFIPKFGNGALTTRLAELKITKNPPALISVYETDTAVSATSLPKNPNTLLYPSAGLPVKGNLCVQAVNPNIKALLHFDDESNPFKDECGNTWAKSGSPAITDDGYFDKALSIQGGESNCLYTKTNFQIGGQDFTIDFWVNFQSGSTQWATVFKFSNGINTFINQYLFLVRKYLNELEIYYSPTTSSSNAVAWHGTSNINDGNWHHLAVTYNYDAQKLYGFVDGVKEIEIDLDFPRTSYAYCVLGRLGNGGRHFYGYIDEVRFVDGQALWTDNFTPPTKPHSFTQTLYAPLVLENSPVDNTVALLHFDDENNPTKDECGNIWHIDGAPYINTSNAKFGNSVHINSTCRIISDYIVNFQGQPLTFDWWGYYTTPRAWKGNVPATFALVDNEGDIKTGGKIDRIYLLCNTSSSFYCFSSYKNGSPKMSSSISYPMNAWHHSAVTYSNGVWRLFIDGVLRITFSFTPTFKKYQINLAANYSAFWGDNFIDTPGYCNFRGYFDEFRFVDGVALYTEDFTPPTAPYTLNTVNGKQPPCIGVRHSGNNFYTVR